MKRNPEEAPIFQSDLIDAQRSEQLQTDAAAYLAGRLALSSQQLRDPLVVSFIRDALSVSQSRATELIAV